MICPQVNEERIKSNDIPTRSPPRALWNHLGFLVLSTVECADLWLLAMYDDSAIGRQVVF